MPNMPCIPLVLQYSYSLGKHASEVALLGSKHGASLGMKHRAVSTSPHLTVVPCVQFRLTSVRATTFVAGIAGALKEGHCSMGCRASGQLRIGGSVPHGQHERRHQKGYREHSTNQQGQLKVAGDLLESTHQQWPDSRASPDGSLHE